MSLYLIRLKSVPFHVEAASTAAAVEVWRAFMDALFKGTPDAGYADAWPDSITCLTEQEIIRAEGLPHADR